MPDFRLSVDSFIAAGIVGAIVIRTRTKIILAVAFGICDALASFAASEWKITCPLPLSISGSFLLAVYLFLVIIASHAATKNIWIFYGLPVFSALDNLVFRSEGILATGVLSAAIAGLGVLLSSSLVRINVFSRSTAVVLLLFLWVTLLLTY
jgi:hypothetical protein